MGRHDASAGRVVPVKPETNVTPSEQIYYEAAIQVASEFVEKGLPGCRQDKPFLVLEHITIMALLPVLARFVEERLKESEIRHVRQQLLESLLG